MTVTCPTYRHCVTVFTPQKYTHPSNRLMHILLTRATWFSCGNVCAGQGVGPFFLPPRSHVPTLPIFISSLKRFHLTPSGFETGSTGWKKMMKKIIIQRILPPPLFHNWFFYRRHLHFIHVYSSFGRAIILETHMNFGWSPHYNFWSSDMTNKSFYDWFNSKVVCLHH